MTLFIALKSIHIACVVISLLGFFVRGWALFIRKAVNGSAWCRVMPHVIDTMLLLSAIGMVVVAEQYSFASDWLIAKIMALLLYITLGMMSFKYFRTRAQGVLYWLLAMLVFGYIIGVAITHEPMSFFMLTTE